MLSQQVVAHGLQCLIAPNEEQPLVCVSPNSPLYPYSDFDSFFSSLSKPCLCSFLYLIPDLVIPFQKAPLDSNFRFYFDARICILCSHHVNKY